MSARPRSAQTRGALYVLAGAVCISVSPLFVGLPDAGPSTVAMYRLFWGGIVLLAVALLRGQRLIPGTSMVTPILLAAAFFSGDLVCWHLSILDVGPGLATILSNFQVFFLALVGIFFFKERLNFRLAIAIPLALLGLWLLLDVRLDRMPPKVVSGLFFGIVSAMFYTGYILTLRRSQSHPARLPAEANMGLISLIAAFMVALIAVAQGENLLVPGMRSNLLMLVYGIGCQGIGWLLLSMGLPHLPASQAGLLMLTQPSLAFLWEVVFFDRPTSFWGYCGAVLALAAICLGVLGKKSQNSTLTKRGGLP